MKTLLSVIMMALLVLHPGLVRAAEDEAPELPKTEMQKGTPENTGEAKSEVEVPSGEPDIKKENVKVVQEKPRRFLWTNFLLGALGGAILTAGLGIPLGAARNSDGGGLDGSKIAILAGGGAVAGGLLSLFLGANSPPAATPPDMSFAPSTGGPVSAKQLVFTVQF